MSDVFSNLAAQSLSSRVGIQPLIAPLFAPALQLLSDATLPTSNEQPAVAAEHATVSITSSIVADRDTSQMEQPSEEVITSEKRMILPDLVPPDVPQNAISILSLRHLLYNRHLQNDIVEAQETTPYGTIPDTLEIPSSSIRPGDQKQTARYSFHAAPTNHEPQRTSQEDHPAIPTGDAPHFQYLAPPSDKQVAPLAIQPALPVSLPSLQPDVQSEHSVNSDEVLDQESSSSAQPQVQSASISARRDQFIAPTAEVPALIDRTPKPMQQTTVVGQPRRQPDAMTQSLRGPKETDIKPLLDQDARAKQPELLQAFQAVAPSNVVQSVEAQSFTPTASAELAERVSISSAPNLPDVRDVLQSPHVSPKQEAQLAKEEGEVPAIRITIGRVVVRATLASEPAPIQKRVLRPAQSLDEYLKQRERGSR